MPEGRVRLRVALDTSFAGINLTGVGKYSRRLAQGLSGRNYSRTLNVRCYGPSCGSGKALLRGLYQEWPTYTQLYLPLSLAKHHIDVVHSTSHLGPVWGAGKRVVTVHDTIFRRYPDDYNAIWLAITNAALPRVIKSASAVITDSEATRSDLEKFFPAARGKAHTVYPGVDEAFFTEVSRDAILSVRQQHSLGNDPYVLLPGPWVRRKNLVTVIEAFGVLAERIKEVNLVVTGEPAAGMQSGETQAALNRLPQVARERVRLAGHVAWDNLVPLMSGASVLAYPSLYEGFGLPPLEAMSAGVPVVIAKTAAVVEATGGHAIAVKPLETQAWITALEHLLTDANSARRWAQEGKKWAQNFTWERCIRETVQIYRAEAK